MNLDPHEQLRAEHDAAMRDYLARGGEIVLLPVGAMATAGWKPEDFALQSPKNKARTMRAREIAKEEHAARKRAKAAEPLPRAVREVREPKARVRKPKPRKERTRNGPPAHRPGTLQHEAWEALAKPMTARALADLKGWSINVTMQRLTRLREHGLIVSTGSKGNMRWSRK